MITPAHFADRRRRLSRLVEGPVLLGGIGDRARNLPMNLLPFRQDSHFLYLTGCDLPGAAALIEGGRLTLFLPYPDEDDALWHGPGPTPEARGAAWGADAVRPIEELEAAVSGLPVLTLAVSDPAVNARLSAITGRPLRFGREPGDLPLVDAMIALRRAKAPEELDAMRAAATLTVEAHRAAMRATRPGVSERALAALFEGYLAARGATTGYSTILTQRGEILHNHDHNGILEAGRLLLLDAGAELPSGYGADLTRTWPVSGRFEPRQRAAYEAVLEAQRAAIAACRPGVRYRAVHDAASLVLARFLADEGLIRVAPEVAVEIGAHALFYPHGTGHHLGLDVHDLEAFGDRPSYPPGQGRPAQFGTRNLRLDLPLEVDWVVTIEPGFYVVPEILADATLHAALGDAIDWERARGWIGFGGIRIEDDVRITAEGTEVLSAALEREPAEVEALVGAGIDLREALCC